MNTIREHDGVMPTIAAGVYLDPSAVLIGKVSIGENSSIWCNAVLRGDVSFIQIGKNTNIQDLSMLHVTHYHPGKTAETPLIIGDNVTIGHSCCIHACTLSDHTFIGMGTTILDHALIEENVMVGAASLVPQGKRLESGFLYFGNPVKKIRPLTADEIEHLDYSAKHYVDVARSYYTLR